MVGRMLGRYRVEAVLGEGGMGTVFRARDTALSRDVALKVIRDTLSAEGCRERFLREARALAAVSHPAVCHVYDVGEADGLPFLAMELLEGETLASRLSRGRLGLADALRIASTVLEALEALHAAGLVHRDLKPGNVFLLKDGRAKLLDFGLVRALNATADSLQSLTAAGAIVGTPAYLAPEQARGEDVDARADVFAAAAVLHEMLSGSPPFRRATLADTIAAILSEPPGPLPAEATGLEPLMRRALSKRREERPSSVADFRSQLLNASGGGGEASGGPDGEMPTLVQRPSSSRVASRSPTPSSASAPSSTSATPATPALPAPRRLAVLPFRLLKPDPEHDFLAFGLADAVATSLSSGRGLLVRPPLATQPYAGASPDLAEITRKLDVDTVLAGTLLAQGGRCRVSVQLLEAPSGNLLFAQNADVTASDIFELQDELARRIVTELRLPLLGGSGLSSSAPPRPPRDPEAFELYLRASQAILLDADLPLAKGLYRRSLERDPDFAPAWARLGRCLRLEAKYSSSGREEVQRQAEEALSRALALDPELPATARELAQLQLERGEGEAAVERLLSAVARNPQDPEGYAGLVTCLRYLGLLPESLAAHRRARSLDSQIVTSVFNTHLALGDVGGMLATFTHEAERFMALWEGRRLEEARELIRRLVLRPAPELMRTWSELMMAAIQDDAATVLASVEWVKDFPDPEGLYYAARVLARYDVETLETLLARAVRGGFVNVPFFERDPALGPYRERPRVAAALAEARARHLKAKERFGGRVT